IERMDSVNYVSIADRMELQLAGYDAAGLAQYTGTATYCTQGRNLDGSMGPASVSVMTISPSGASTVVQQYQSGSCPFTLGQFDSIAPVVTPSSMPVDWSTGHPR
ncbi:MAG TPA: hypothetical protein VFL64_00780, partial [Rhizobacter sp.]|nr:hypothetical protein [Rhizobacter sp.]